MARGVDWSKQARSDVKKLSKRDTDRVTRALHRLAASGRGNVERLRSFAPPLYRLRVGSWRVSFRYEHLGTAEECLSVERVLHRRDIYRKSGLARQEIPGGKGFNEAGDWERAETCSEQV